MSTTTNDIRIWLTNATKAGATHVIIVCDTLDYDDFPVYVFSDQESCTHPLGEVGTAREVYDRLHGVDLQQVMEVYSLRGDIESQLIEHRAFHFD